jgi:hypothetical protein
MGVEWVIVNGEVLPYRGHRPATSPARSVRTSGVIEFRFLCYPSAGNGKKGFAP